MRTKKPDHSIIDMSLESNFGICERRKPMIPVGRPGDIISTILSTVIGVVAGLGTGVTFGGLTGLLITVATWTIVAVVVGLTIWSMVGGKKSGASNEAAVEQNGQLVNTRQASKPLFVVYGVTKVGGNWVFSRPSGGSNTYLNVLITWSEGEIEGLATAIDYTPLYSGTTLDDIHTGGEYVPSCACNGPCYSHTSCSCDMTYY